MRIRQHGDSYRNWARFWIPYISLGVPGATCFLLLALTDLHSITQSCSYPDASLLLLRYDICAVGMYQDLL